jgi:hypothetical protein
MTRRRQPPPTKAQQEALARYLEVMAQANSKPIKQESEPCQKST